MKEKLVILTLLASLSLTGCSNGLYKTNNENYREINAIEGITFEIPDSAFESATAITQISPSEEYSSNEMYLYKNGIDEYLLFCMNSVVIAIEKGTNYKFEDQEKDSKAKALENDSILGIWLKVEDDKLTYQEKKSKNTYKMIGDANAEVVITDEIFKDFTGKVASVSNGTEEWTLFVGMPTDIYKNAEKADIKILENISKSLTITDNYTKLGATEEKAEKDNTPNKDTVSNNKDESIISEEKTDIENKEDVPVEEKKQAEENGDIVNEEKQKSESINLTNQRESMTKDVKINGIYDMLEVGEKGIVTCVSKKGLNYPAVTVEDIYMGDKAKDFVSAYMRENPIYKSSKAPDGCSWNVIKYSVDYTDCEEELYINVKLRGLDGENLKYRGIKYSKKTYDILTMSERNGSIVSNMYCFYPVPNGCNDYALEIGDGTNETVGQGIASSYFRIHS